VRIFALSVVALLALSSPAASETIQGRWKLIAAEDMRPDGTVGRLPWGAHPAGTIVVQDGACYLQIMSTDVPSFPARQQSTVEQMKAALLSTYIAYTGPCTIDEAAGKVTLQVQGAWRPDYVGSEQVRYFRFEGGKMFFGPGPNTNPQRGRGETLQRRLTLVREN
jgi:lipocalin-like protein